MASTQPGTELFGLEDLIASFAESIPHVQCQLDSEWAASADRYFKALGVLATEWASLAVECCPVRQVVLESGMSTSFVFQYEQATQWRVGLLNLAFERKFQHSDFVRQTLTAKVVAHSWEKEKLHG